MYASKSFGQWLKQRRKALDLTREALAQRIGCAVVTLNKIEADERRPSQQLAELLAEHLNIPVDQRAVFIRFARGEAADHAAPFRPPSNLPVPPTALIGREWDIAALRKRLLQPETRLLTLVGPPGIGKTRLALQVAADLLDEYGDGVFFVALAPIRDAALVSTTIASTLSIPDMGSQPMLQRLKTFLREKHMLLVLDNFEQLLPAAAQIAELLGACPWVNLLVTSRAPLRVRSERQFPVPPLALPEPDQLSNLQAVSHAAAVTLFLERAQAVKPDFTLTPENASTVVAICMRLDGLPLAIELISARVKLLPPATLLERLSGRVLLQSAGLHDSELRHQTLNAAIEWSYQLLNAEEQTLFRRLGVFVGGWTLEAAEAVCMENLKVNVIDCLASLLDKSMIKQESMHDGTPRFTMLETIREYALERLTVSKELDALQQQHAAYFLTFAATNQTGMTGAQQALWWERLELEQPNFRAALAWSHERSSSETELQFMLALREFWQLHGHLNEGTIWLTNALERQAHESVGAFTETQSRIRARSLVWLSIFLHWKGTLDLGQPLLEEALALFRALGDTAAVADALGDYGMLLVLRGDHEQAGLLLNESLALRRQLDRPMDVVTSLLFLGNLAYSQELTTRAGELWGEALALVRPFEDLWTSSVLLAQLAMVALENRDYHQAAIQLTESLTILQQLDERWQIAHTLEVCACFAAVQDQPRGLLDGFVWSARIFGAAEKLRETIAAPVFPFQQRFNERGLATLQAKLDEATLKVAWAEGRAMTLRQVIANVLETVLAPSEDQE